MENHVSLKINRNLRLLVWQFSRWSDWIVWNPCTKDPWSLSGVGQMLRTKAASRSCTEERLASLKIHKWNESSMVLKSFMIVSFGYFNEFWKWWNTIIWKGIPVYYWWDFKECHEVTLCKACELISVNRMRARSVRSDPPDKFSLAEREKKKHRKREHPVTKR